MARIRRLTGARAWAARLSGLLVIAAIVALIVAVLPVFGSVVDPPEIVELGGQGNDCSQPAIGYGNTHDFRIDNPLRGENKYTDESTGAEFTLDLAGNNKTFDLLGTSEATIYAFVVKGGQNSAFYDYFAILGNGVTADTDIRAPEKKNGNFSVSHISICYVQIGTISGKVWHDNDQDGVQDDGTDDQDGSKNPVEGLLATPAWTINLYPDNGPAQTTPATGGTYSFPNLPLGDTYTICEVAPAGQWAQSNLSGTVECTTGGEEPQGHVITLQADVADADFGNFETVFAGCGSVLDLGGNTITFPPTGPLCDKPNTEYVYETYIRGSGAEAEQVVDFHPLSGAAGTAKLVEVFVWSINEIQNSTTLMYNDIIPNVPANDRVALYCNHDPRDPDTGLLDEDLVPPTMDVLPGPGTGGAEPDGSHTTCIIESVENADGSRTDVLYTEIDGRAWV
ncbi:MAG: hypothetical protein O6705_07980 [Actinobacteria bacterium]|nr:hypothetical protein [Actinomycetota bacterium]MCZ6630763.1 hypothetical protein [Actinomycetota bacterium]